MCAIIVACWLATPHAGAFVSGAMHRRHKRTPQLHTYVDLVNTSPDALLLLITGVHPCRLLYGYCCAVGVVLVFPFENIAKRSAMRQQPRQQQQQQPPSVM